MTTAASVEQKQADRKLAVDTAYQTLEEYKIKRRRIFFIADDEKRLGGFGIVRKARLRASAYVPTWLGRSGQPQVVAVKEIKLSGMHEAYDLKRAFTKEVLVWSRLRGHPGIAQFLGFCADFDRKEAWLISPWEPCGNVSEFLRGRELEVPEKLSLAYDTIDALAYLHQMDPPVCHGDIKSANILVTVEGRALLCDFGLARLYEDNMFGSLESTTGFKGSIRWCSPELLNGQPRAVTSDIYAWAWVVWEIMTGEVPYQEAVAEYVIMRKIFESPLPQVDGESRLRDCLLVWEVMTKCWAVDPLQRPTAAICKATVEDVLRCPPTSKTADSHPRFPALLVNLGELESWKGNYKAAYAYLERALSLYEEEKNDEGIASVLRKQAAVAYRDSNHVKIMSAASAALKKCRSLHDDLGIADALFWIGRSFLMENRSEEALSNLQESLKIFRANGSSMGLAKCLERIGELHQRQGLYTKALPSYEEAVDIASRCGDRLGEANALIGLGAVHGDLHHIDQATPTLRRALDIARNIGWEHGVVTCLCHLGIINVRRGLHGEAEELLRESVRVARDSDAGWRLAQALHWAGRCFWAQGRHEEAISHMEESYTLYRERGVDFSSTLAWGAARLGDWKSNLSYQEEALVWYDRAIAEWRKREAKYKDRIQNYLAKRDAILAVTTRRNTGALHIEASS